MKFLDYFGTTTGKLRRGDRALQREIWEKAESRFGSAWRRLEKRRRKGSPDTSSETRALRGLAQAASGAGRAGQAIDHCRAGRRLRLNDRIFYELPPTHALSLPPAAPIPAKALEDLVAWACWPGAPASSVPRGQVESRLQQLLKPRRTGGLPSAGRVLGQLEGSPLRWIWPPLYLAEAARYREDWRQAAAYLGRAIALQPSESSLARLLWSRAHCLWAANREDEGRAVMVSAWKRQRPRVPVQWFLAARLSIAANDGRFALKAIQAGLAADPDNAGLLLDPRRLCRGNGDWQVVRSIVERLVTAAQGKGHYAPALRLQCAVAMHLKDAELAATSARQLLDDPSLMAGPHQGLRAWTAAVLASEGALSPAAVTALLRGVRTKRWQRRIRLAEFSVALASDDEERIRASWETVGRDGILLRNDPQWQPFSLRLARHLLFYAGQSQQLVTSGETFDLARAGIHRRLFDAGSSPAELHSLALINLSLLVRRLWEGSIESALERLCEALGAWASLLHDSQAIDSFAAARYRSYGKSGAALGADRIRDLVAARILALVEPHGTACGISPARLELMWELECRAAATVAQLGGLATGSTANGRSEVRLHAGPLLTRVLGLEEAVFQLIERPPSPTFLDTSPMAQLMALVTQGFVAQPQAEDRASLAEVRRLFSPLGPAAILLRRRQFHAVGEELERVGCYADGKLPEADPLLDLLAKLLGKGKKRWLKDASRELLSECHLETSRDQVAQVPVPFDELRATWRAVLHATRSTRDKDQIRRAVGEIAVGRGRALMRKRTRAERQDDANDQRSNPVRLLEARRLMTLAWDLTSETIVQGPLAELLNVLAVRQADEEHFDGAVESLCEALRIKPTSRRAADNLVILTLNQVKDRFDDGDSDAAGHFLLTTVEKIRGLDGSGSEPEIRRCLDKLADQGSTPFFNSSLDASREEDWVTATDLMVWCLRIAPGDRHVLHGSHTLREGLRQQSFHGDELAMECLTRLEGHLPAGPVVGLQQAMLLQALNELGAMVPEPGNADMLNRRAVAVAQAGRFEEAIGLLAQARRIDRRSQVVRRNVNNVGQAWLRKAAEAGDIAEMMRIRSRLREIG